MRFRAPLEARDGGGHLVALPFDAEQAFRRVRAPVRVTVNEHTFRTTTMRYGGVDYIGLNRVAREEARAAAGDTLTVVIELDTEPRTVEIPADLERAFADAPGARAAYDGLSFTHRKEYVRWITEAKRPDTRRRRVAQAVAMLLEGARTPDAARRAAV
jgi:bacteriocin resistance YdeI/OmpD-like protein/uncharacterized protein DUF1905